MVVEIFQLWLWCHSELYLLVKCVFSGLGFCLAIFVGIHSLVLDSTRKYFFKVLSHVYFFFLSSGWSASRVLGGLSMIWRAFSRSLSDWPHCAKRHPRWRTQTSRTRGMFCLSLNSNQKSNSPLLLAFHNETECPACLRLDFHAEFDMRYLLKLKRCSG